MESTMPTIAIGTTFASITEGKKTILEYIIGRGESYRVQKADKRCWLAVCKDVNCPFRIRLSRTNDIDECKLTILVEHTCPISTHQGFRSAHSVSHLVENHLAAVADNRTIGPKQIQSSERLQHGNSITYKQAWRTKEFLRLQIDGEDSQAFRKIPALLSAMAGDEEDTYWKLQNHGGRFQRCFVAPAATRHAFQYCRRFVALDCSNVMIDFGTRDHRTLRVLGGTAVIFRVWGVSESFFANWGVPQSFSLFWMPFAYCEMPDFNTR